MEDDLTSLKKREVYKKYLGYCDKNKLLPVNQIKFGRDFKAITGCGHCEQNKIPSYSGVNWKNDEIRKPNILDGFSGENE